MRFYQINLRRICMTSRWVSAVLNSKTCTSAATKPKAAPPQVYTVTMNTSPALTAGPSPTAKSPPSSGSKTLKQARSFGTT